jgi:hypothetical protein
MIHWSTFPAKHIVAMGTSASAVAHVLAERLLISYQLDGSIVMFLVSMPFV